MPFVQFPFCLEPHGLHLPFGSFLLRLFCSVWPFSFAVWIFHGLDIKLCLWLFGLRSCSCLTWVHYSAVCCSYLQDSIPLVLPLSQLCWILVSWAVGGWQLPGVPNQAVGVFSLVTGGCLAWFWPLCHTMLSLRVEHHTVMASGLWCARGLLSKMF